jgi:hypothetical protein
MEYDGSGYYHEYKFDDEAKNTLYPYEDTSYTQFDAYWRAERYLINIMNNINFYNDDINKKKVVELFTSALDALKNRYENFEQRIYINNKESYIQYSVYH